jgi:hypothetical protein
LHFANAVYGHNFVHGNYECTHPNAHEPLPAPKNADEARMLGEFEAILRKNGRNIGVKDSQPNWCPILNEGKEINVL